MSGWALVLCLYANLVTV